MGWVYASNLIRKYLGDPNSEHQLSLGVENDFRELSIKFKNLNWSGFLHSVEKVTQSNYYEMAKEN